MVSLQQLGVFGSWIQHGQGTVPGEGAAFLVLEDQERATQRSARIYARIRPGAFRSVEAGRLSEAMTQMLSSSHITQTPRMIAAGDGDVLVSRAEQEALTQSGIEPSRILHPKAHLGNTFAAAAAIQVGLAAAMASQAGCQAVLANCAGFGTELGCFVLEAL
jgi:3-oxoacyl-(acyl-carrier-protein) synthase